MANLSKRKRKTHFGTCKNVHKKKKSNERSNSVPCPYLYDDVLHKVIQRLDLLDFYQFEVVCKRWHNSIKLYKQIFKPSPVPPLALTVTKGSTQSCTFHDIFSKRSQTWKLPDFKKKSFLGASNGFIIIYVCSKLDQKGEFLLLNPITGESHRFSCPVLRYDRAIVVPNTVQGKGLMIIANSKISSSTVYCWSSKEYTVHSYKGRRRTVWQLAYFKGIIYGLTSSCELSILDPKSGFNLIKLKIKNEKAYGYPCRRRLVASKERLMMYFYDCQVGYEFYELDFEELVWRRIKNLGDVAIFEDNSGFSLVGNANQWGGQNNLVYDFGDLVVKAFALDSGETGTTFSDDQYSWRIGRSDYTPKLRYMFWYDSFNLI